MIDYLQHGLEMSDFALATNRVSLGVFFAISGYHKLFHPIRRQRIRETMHNLNIPFPEFNARFVPSVEFLGGLSLLSGILSPFAAVGLFIICLVAVCTDGLPRIPKMQPVDKADWLDDLLYLPEVLYLFGLAIVIFGGPGSFRLI